jgi:hypothetical protein
MMSTPDALQHCWEGAQGRCQCARSGHEHHAGGCSALLELDRHGFPGDGGWVALASTAPRAGGARGGPNRREVVCWDCAERILRQPAFEFDGG